MNQNNYSAAFLGQNIRELRKFMGLSQEELASRACVTQQAIQQYEQGKVAPSIETAQRICECLGVSTSEILTLEIRPAHVRLDKSALVKMSEKLEDQLFFSHSEEAMKDPAFRAAYELSRDFMDLTRSGSTNPDQIFSLYDAITKRYSLMLSGSILDEEIASNLLLAHLLMLRNKFREIYLTAEKLAYTTQNSRKKMMKSALSELYHDLRMGSNVELLRLCAKICESSLPLVEILQKSQDPQTRRRGSVYEVIFSLLSTHPMDELDRQAADLNIVKLAMELYTSDPKIQDFIESFQNDFLISPDLGSSADHL